MSLILITGGAGMIGSSLTKKLCAIGHDVLIVDNLWRGRKEFLYNDNGDPCIDLDSSFYELDLACPGQIDSLLSDVDYVFHLADVVAGIEYVFSHERQIFRQNMLINSNVLDSVSKANVRGLIYVGTACSFPQELQNGVDSRPLIESDQYPASPESAYGWSKLMGEYETLLLEKEIGVPVSIPVLHNVYGAPCNFDTRTSQVLPALVRRVIESNGEPIIVWGSGTQGRAFVHVNDVVNGLIASMKYGLGEGVIQLGPDVCTSIREAAETIVDVSGKALDIQFDSSKPEGDRGRRANYDKATRLLGWKPKVNFREGIEELYQWMNSKITKH